MEWHSYAKLFPMLPEVELQALADDIAKNGQRHPIITDPKNRIIDGRARAVACKIAGVTPVLECQQLADLDVLGLIFSSNSRHQKLTEGQRAMIVARAFPDADEVSEQYAPRVRPGFVYVMGNESMPGILKVGMTGRNPIERAADLFTTAVPLPFDVHFSIYVPDARRAEQESHAALSRHRVHESREFFECSLREAVSAVCSVSMPLFGIPFNLPEVMEGAKSA